MYIYYHQLSHCIFRSLTYTTFKQTIPINIIAYLSLHRRCRQNASIQPLPLPLLSLHCCRQHHPPAADTTHHFWLQKHVRPSVFGPAAVIVRVLFASADVLNSFCGYSTVPLQQFRAPQETCSGLVIGIVFHHVSFTSTTTDADACSHTVSSMAWLKQLKLSVICNNQLEIEVEEGGGDSRGKMNNNSKHTAINPQQL